VVTNGSDERQPLDDSELDYDVLVTGFARHLGLEITEVSSDRVVGRWSAASHLTDKAGLVHRGAHSSVIETLASVAAAVWLGDRGKVVGVNNNTDFFGRTDQETSLLSVATPLHRDDDQQLWQVETVDTEGTRVALGQVRLQNLYPRG